MEEWALSARQISDVVFEYIKYITPGNNFATGIQLLEPDCFSYLFISFKFTLLVSKNPASYWTP